MHFPYFFQNALKLFPLRLEGKLRAPKAKKSIHSAGGPVRLERVLGVSRQADAAQTVHGAC